MCDGILLKEKTYDTIRLNGDITQKYLLGIPLVLYDTIGLHFVVRDSDDIFL